MPIENDPEETGLVVSTPNIQAEVITIEDQARMMAAKVELFNKMLPTLVKLCTQGDITDYGGRPFVGDNGCEKMASVLGISFTQPTIMESWEENPEKPGEKVFVCLVSGSATVFGRSIYADGGCDSEDKFFTRKDTAADGTETYVRRRGLSLSRLRLDVRKKAMANWRGSCIRILLGLKNLEWSVLENMGYRRGEGGSVQFKDGSGKRTPVEAATDIKSQIEKMIFDDCKGNKEIAGEILSAITSFEGDKGTVEGPKSVHASNFSDKWAFRVWSEIKPGGKKHDDYKNRVDVKLKVEKPEEPKK